MGIKRQILSLIFVALGAFSSSAQISGQRLTPRTDIVGGWQKAKVDDVTRKAAADVMLTLKRPHARLAAINSVETQVVAGRNYRLHLTLSDHSRWEAVVWQHLNGAMEVTSTRQLS